LLETKNGFGAKANSVWTLKKNSLKIAADRECNLMRLRLIVAPIFNVNNGVVPAPAVACIGDFIGHQPRLFEFTV
jgi:hypothetical protein